MIIFTTLLLLYSLWEDHNNKQNYKGAGLRTESISTRTIILTLALVFFICT